jgi:DNA-binding GntR family transcriptional regulator
MNEGDIHQILSQAILAGHIPAGTKLGERLLSEAFEVSRERIRKVLHRLGHERLLDVKKNRGAFAIAPDPRQVGIIFEARRILESGVVADLAGRLTEEQIARLQSHIERERLALQEGRRAAWVGLSSDFHLLLADMTDNPIIRLHAQELVGRTMMIVAGCEPNVAAACGCDEHRLIFKALAAGNRGKAVRAMANHLSIIETRLRLRARLPADFSLGELIQEELALWRATRNEASTSYAAPGPDGRARAPRRAGAARAAPKQTQPPAGRKRRVSMEG